MGLLLHTHSFLCAIAGDPLLGPISRGDMPISAVQALAWAEESGFDWLPLAPGHILTLENLPLHHHDPYRCAEDFVIDRLLIAQAISE
jgi:PIN domain nuclease of toxin-antitoxin system